MIYVVEDDKSICDLMVYSLNKGGFEAEGFEDGIEFTEALSKKTPELVMLDIMLPGEDGLRLLQKLRERPETKDIPVILETAKTSEIDKVRGLNMGADDYLAKPFGMLEMVARVRAVLRRHRLADDENDIVNRADADIIRVGNIVINTSGRKVMICDGSDTSTDVNVELTFKEYEILKLFAERPGMAFSREQILSYIWGIDYFGETRTVDVQIGALRSKLNAAGKCNASIDTVRGVGYRMEPNASDRDLI